MSLYATFQRYFAEKRYKLINFAPNFRIVENYRTCLIFSKKELTAVVNNVKPQENNLMSKKMSCKFCTNPHHIILLISIFKRKKKNKKIMICC